MKQSTRILRHVSVHDHERIRNGAGNKLAAVHGMLLLVTLAGALGVACGGYEAASEPEGTGEPVATTQYAAKNFVHKSTKTIASCADLDAWNGVVNQNVIFPAGCSYKGQVKFITSDVTLDCRNSTIEGSPGGNIIVAKKKQDGQAVTPTPGIQTDAHESHSKYHHSLDNTNGYKPLLAGIVVGRAADPATGPCAQDPVVEDITIRNCRVRAFYQGIRVERTLRRERRDDGTCGTVDERTYYTGYVPPPAGQQLDYDVEFGLGREALYQYQAKHVRIIDSVTESNGHTGIYLMPYVQFVSIENTVMANNGAVGLYLSHETRYNRVLGSTVSGNGFGSASPPVAYDFPGAEQELQKKEREGIAIDSSAHNVFSHNDITGNYRGGVMLYKNCGEDHSAEKPSVIRKQHSDYNLFVHNTIAHHTEREGEESGDTGYGIWLAMRQGVSWADCRDPKATTASGEYNHDYANFNTITFNRFENNWTSLQVSDDYNNIIGNEFRGPTKYDMHIGNNFRRELQFPVRGTTVVKNRSYSTTSNVSKRTIVPDEGSGSQTFFLGQMYQSVGTVNSPTMHCLTVNDDAPFNDCTNPPEAHRERGIFWD